MSATGSPGSVEGLLLVDKPSGPTSHDVVARARRLLGVRRIGHTGTLDPMASGLLPLAVGRATRLIRFLPSAPKVYRGTIRLGRVTDTDDVTGAPVSIHDGPLPDATAVRAAAETLAGRILQTPPSVSAKKIAGVRAYRLVRRGREARPDAVEVEVRWTSLEPAAGEPEPGCWSFEVAVSTGTYVRALARDLGERLGCGGTLARLRRVRIGPLDVADASPLPDPGTPEADGLPARVVPLRDLPLTLPSVVLVDPDAVRAFRSGRTAPEPPGADPGGDPTHRAVRGPDGALLGVAERDAGGLRPRVVLAPS